MPFFQLLIHAGFQGVFPLLPASFAHFPATFCAFSLRDGFYVCLSILSSPDYMQSPALRLSCDSRDWSQFEALVSATLSFWLVSLFPEIFFSPPSAPFPGDSLNQVR